MRKTVHHAINNHTHYRVGEKNCTSRNKQTHAHYRVGEKNCTSRNKQPHALQGGREKLHNKLVAIIRLNFRNPFTNSPVNLQTEESRKWQAIMEEVDKGCSEFPCNGPCCLCESFFFFLITFSTRLSTLLQPRASHSEYITDRTDGRTDSQAGRQTDRQTELTDRQTDRHEAKQWNKVTMTVYTTTV